MTSRPPFLQRFEQIRTSLRYSEGWLGLAATVLTAAIGLGFLAWSDFAYELSLATRTEGLTVATLILLLVAGRFLVAPIRWWTRPRTAVAIEERFPELGQRIRTVVQYAGRPDAQTTAAGVRPGLVRALEVETEERATPLPIDRVVRWGRVQLLAAVALIPVTAIGLAAIESRDWRIALGRAVLIDRPYTTVEVLPGDVEVDQGRDVTIKVVVRGRPRQLVTLFTRPQFQTDAPWRSSRLGTLLEAPVVRVNDPLEYRVVAGPASSPSYSIGVRYPLAIRAVEVEIKAPAYTGLDPQVLRGGNVRAVEGSVGTFKVTIETIPSAASLELIDPAQPVAKPSEASPVPSPTVLPLKLVGNSFVATLDLTKNLDYRVVARTTDGRVLAPNKFRIDVIEDRAPRISFDEPDEVLEIHPIAEVQYRARVLDDFGLTRAGIVFRFNDNPEQTLILRDFPVTPGQKPPTAATLEEVLLTETLHATPRDAVTYFGFAEDNFPGGSRRTETDLRYVDFRPFKRDYKLAEPGTNTGDPQTLVALDELIARQRVNLNRATRLVKRRPNDRTEADDPAQVAAAEESLMILTREFTAGVEELADDRVEPLHRAESAMQAAIDAFDLLRSAAAPPAMAEALKHLVAARRELFTLFGKNAALAQAVRSFDRRQAQKIRLPKGQTQDQESEEIANRLEALAQEEERIYVTIAQSMAGAGSPPPPPAAQGEPGDPKPSSAPGENGQPEPQGEGNPKQADPKLSRGEANAGDPDKLDRRGLAARQSRLAAEVRDLEAKLRRLEAASDLARGRLARAAETVEEAAAALDRGDPKGAATVRAAAGMLHELARQEKGETAREVADQLGMARDLAAELARRAGELAARIAPASAAATQTDPSGAGRLAPTEAEQVDRMTEMTRTLEAWLQQINRRGEANSAEAVRAILDGGTVAEAVERAERMGNLQAGGQRAERSQAARDQAARLETLGQMLDRLHQGLVGPELAALADLDRRLSDLSARLANLKTEAEVAAWKREVAPLIRDLEQARIAGAVELADALRAGGWHWDARQQRPIGADNLDPLFGTIASRIKERIQDLILKDLASARDEATPPMFRALVDRYYEVISRGAGAK